MTPAGMFRLKADEGCRFQAYQDEGGVWTIGYGQTGPGIVDGTVWSAQQIEAAFLASVAEAEHNLTVELPWFTTLDPVRQDVLINIAFNVGVSGLEHWPNTLKLFEEKDFASASQALLHEGKWNKQVGKRANRLSAATASGSWNGLEING